jgi:hypothetical protein
MSENRVTLEWSSMWSWFSDCAGPEEQKETIKYIVGTNIFRGMTEAGLIDALTGAPRELIVYLRDNNKIPDKVARIFLQEPAKLSTDVAQDTLNWATQRLMKKWR